MELVTSQLLAPFFKDTWRQLSQAGAHLWKALPATEGEASRIFKLITRSASIVHVHVLLYWKRWPHKLFGILDMSMQSKVIEELLTAKPCQLEPISQHFRTIFPDRASLLGERCHQVLSALASQMKATTWSTECLHARHARRARSRVHSHPVDLPTLAGMHSASTSPSWQRRLETSAGEVAVPTPFSPEVPHRMGALIYIYIYTMSMI